jgi:hypothetical protein
MRSTTLLPAQRSERAEVRQCRDDLKTGPLMSDADAEDLIADRQPFTTAEAALAAIATSPPG